MVVVNDSESSEAAVLSMFKVGSFAVSDIIYY